MNVLCGSLPCLCICVMCVYVLFKRHLMFLKNFFVGWAEEVHFFDSKNFLRKYTTQTKSLFNGPALTFSEFSLLCLLVFNYLFLFWKLFFE